MGTRLEPVAEPAGAGFPPSAGLLCATEQGAALYRRLGWTEHGTVRLR